MNQNRIEVYGDYAYLFVPVGKTYRRFVVDSSIIPAIRVHKWRVITSNGAKYASNENDIMLHRFIMSPKEDEVVDHISGDTTDNRRQNLRIATLQQNTWNNAVRKDNKLGFKGVYLDTTKGKYRASIQVDGRRISLGLYDTAEEAALKYNAAAIQHFGEFARLNDVKAEQ
jgi:hypothetical protein